MRPPDDKPPVEMPASGVGDSLRVVLLAIVGLFLARLPLLSRRTFDPDELEHAHAAWCFFKGMVPYKDFFEHHTPWYYYLLRPLFAWFGVDTSFESAQHFLLLGRGISLALAILSVVLVCLIGHLWAGKRVGYLAGLFLLAQPIFLQKSLEMRPDMLALPFFLGALWFLLRGLQASSSRRVGWFLGAGLSVGAAIMSTQKMIFVLPGAFGALGVWALFVRKGRGGRATQVTSRILTLVALLVGIAIPAALTWGAFALRHADGEFITNNFLLNSRWKHTPTGQFLKLLTTSGPVLALALVGAWLSLRRFWQAEPERRDHGEFLLLCTVVGLFVGVLIIPVAQRQYYLMPLPLFCLFGVKGLDFLLERAPKAKRAALLLVSALALAVLPVIALVQSFLDQDDQQLTRLRQVFETTKPTDVVMDGWQGMGVFRPHALYHYFLHDEALAMLSADEVNVYVKLLESGKVRPRLIAMDEHLYALGDRFVGFVARHYTSRDGFFYYARGSEP